MKAIAVVLCLAGSAALWIWAVRAPKPVEPLEQKFQGVFELYRVEIPEGQVGEDPTARNQRWRFEFGADHLYRFRILLEGGYEMSRRAGIVTIERSPEGNEFLVMTQSTSNEVEEKGEPDRYLAEWGTDEQGPYLLLTSEDANRRGQRWYLRRVESAS